MHLLQRYPLGNWLCLVLVAFIQGMLPIAGIQMSVYAIAIWLLAMFACYRCMPLAGIAPGRVSARRNLWTLSRVSRPFFVRAIPMKKTFCLLAVVPVLLVACGGGEKKAASPDVLVLPGDATLDARSVDYTCDDGRTFSVQYLNKGDNHLAVVPVSDRASLVFSNVLSASGAKYAAGQYVWWTKGEEATLYKDWKGGEPADGVSCKER